MLFHVWVIPDAREWRKSAQKLNETSVDGPELESRLADELPANHESPAAEKHTAETGRTRRSDRISLEALIEIVGSDADGFTFIDSTRTLLVSKHGAKIILARRLGLDQEITITCKTTGKEVAARIVGELGQVPEGYFYGIAFLDQEIDLWGIEFPELSESEKAAARVLPLECAICHTREVTYLDASDAEVFELHRCLSIFCKRCSNTTIWRPAPAALDAPAKMAAEQPAATPKVIEPAVPDPAIRTEDERKETRVRLRMVVGIRDSRLGEEVTETLNISRAGFCFVSRKQYSVGSVIQAALPYASDQANIFCPGRIAHAEAMPEEGLFSYGVSYIPSSHVWQKS